MYVMHEMYSIMLKKQQNTGTTLKNMSFSDYASEGKCKHSTPLMINDLNEITDIVI